MLAIERRREIIERLNQDGRVIVSPLAIEFNVTEETIRRDIEKLESEGLATKTYGGAVATTQKNKDLPYTVRKQSNVALKQKIAKRVAEMIHEGDQIILDASSTSIFVARAIKKLEHLTLITNSVEILLELADKTGWTILSTGGSLREGAYSLSGSSAEKMIRDHHVDLAVCSAKGIDINMGITESNEKDAEMKKAIFAAANKRILALDSTKFDKISFIRVCDLRDIDVIVTDKDPSDAWKNEFENRKVQLEVYGDNDESTYN